MVEWGRSTSRAFATDCGFHLPCAGIAVTVVAYRPTRSCTGRLIYSRLRVSSRYGTTRVALATCKGAAT